MYLGYLTSPLVIADLHCGSATSAALSYLTAHSPNTGSRVKKNGIVTRGELWQMSLQA